jgi:hypothetical protein
MIFTNHQLCHCTDDVTTLKAGWIMVFTNHQLCRCADDVTTLKAANITINSATTAG